MFQKNIGKAPIVNIDKHNNIKKFFNCKIKYINIILLYILMDNDNEIFAISGESITLNQINANLDVLTNNIYSMMNMGNSQVPSLLQPQLPNTNNTSNLFQNLFQTPIVLQHPPSIFNRTNSNLNTIIQQSFSEKNKFKNILSKEGQDLIVFDTFTPEKYTTIKCPITQAPFEVNDSIAVLPCKHVFDKDSIMEWLNNENALCPVCRYKLPNKEVKINNNEETENVDTYGNNEPELPSDIEWTNNPLYEPPTHLADISENIDNLWNSFVTDIDNTLNDISNNITDNSNNAFDNSNNAFGTFGTGSTNMRISMRNYNRYIRNLSIPQTPITNSRPLENRFYRSLLSNLISNNEEEEERQIQRAIIASLQEDISNNQTD